MNEYERMILQYCSGDEWKSLTPLEKQKQISHSTLYRLSKALCGRNWLTHRKGLGYRTTPRGMQALSESSTQVETVEKEASRERSIPPKKPSVDLPAIQRLLKLSDKQIHAMVCLYPPLQKVPTPTHQAMIELLWAEVCDRTWPDTEDHHLNFLQFGETLTWKTSGAQFCAHMIAGDDITPYIIELSTEGGCSLWVRKTSTGRVTFKRELLEGSYVCLEDYHKARREGKQAAEHLLTGRTKIPVEDEIQAIQCVTVINLNPKEGDALFEQTGFDGSHIRRMVPCNLNALELPDLRKTGQEALDAARQVGALEMKEPASSCKAHRDEMNTYMEELFTEEGLRYIDIEGLLNIARGLTGYGFTPSEALRYVLYKVSFPYHTVGWLRPEWVEGVHKERSAVEIRKPLAPKSISKKIQLDTVEQLRFQAEKRQQIQQLNNVIQKLSPFDSSACITLKESFIDLKEAVDRATSKEELDKLIAYQESVLQPRLQGAIEKGRRANLLKYAQDHAEEIKQLFRCIELLDLEQQPAEELEKILEDVGCIEKAPNDLVGSWKGVDGESVFPWLITWGGAKQLLWARLQKGREILKRILPLLSQKEADLVRTGLDPIKILDHQWVYYNPPRSTHVITLFNAIECKFDVKIVISFKDICGMLLKKSHPCSFTIGSGKRIVRVEVGQVMFGGWLLDSAPDGASTCDAKVVSQEPNTFQ